MKFPKKKSGKKTSHSKSVKKADDLCRNIIKKRHGLVCQICGKKANTYKTIGVFHVLGKKAFPNMRFDPRNLLWAGWFCCHYNWHHDPFFARDFVFPKLNKLLGSGWEEGLKKISQDKGKLFMPDVLEHLQKVWKSTQS